MNQILDYNPDGQKSGGPKGSDKIVRNFAIIIIVFAIVLIVIAVSRLMNREDISPSAGETSEKTEPKIEVEEKEESITISVTNEYEIEQLVYSWNESNETVIKGEGQKTLEKEIQLPVGTNSFYAKVTDIKGNFSTFQKEYTSETGKDILNPKIELSVTNDKKLKIVATDETEMSFITYRWNEEEEQRLEVNPDTPKTITTTIEIPHGENDITVNAVDKEKNAVSQTKSFKGLTKPEIKFVINSEGEPKITVEVTHENGIKGVSGVKNNEDFRIEEDVIQNKPSVTFELVLTEGFNKIQVFVSSVDGTENSAEEVFTVSANGIVNGDVTETPPEDTKPVITADLTENKDLYFDIKYSKGLKSATLQIGDQSYTLGITEGQKEANASTPIPDGESKIKIIAEGVDGVKEEFEKTFKK